MSDLVKLDDVQTLSHKKYILRNFLFDLKKRDGTWERQSREVYDHGNAATALLYNRKKKTIILVKQFRIVVYLDKEPTGMLLEACAGLLEGGDPKEGIIREIEEETGYHITEVKQVYEAYASAGSLSEKLFFFIAEYKDSQKLSKGGGLHDEQEELEVIEMSFGDAIQLLRDGKIKDVKTIVLLQYAIINDIFN